MLSRDALEHRLAECIAKASSKCPSLEEKRVTLHVLRHAAAMRLLRAGVDLSTIALWLGHEQMETTQIYLHADLALKEKGPLQDHASQHQSWPLPTTRRAPYVS